MIFVDTSAFLATLDADDRDHARAAEAFREHVGAGALLTHNYVLVETTALVQRRLGPDALRAFLDDLLPVVDIGWIDRGTHAAAIAALLAAPRRRVSFVDWVSFEFMRRMGVSDAFAFDRDFAAQGFRSIP